MTKPRQGRHIQKMSLLNGAWNLSRSVFYRDFAPTALRKFVA